MTPPLAASLHVAAPSEDARPGFVRRVGPWDRQGLTRLYHEFAPLVHAVVLARAPASEADDLVQETFVRAIRSIGSLRPDAQGDYPIGPWLATIARNLATDRARRRARKAPEPRQGPLSSDPADLEALLRALRQLPDSYAEPLILRLVHSMPGPRIAALLGMTPGSVRVNLHRGMELLRLKMGVER